MTTALKIRKKRRAKSLLEGRKLLIQRPPPNLYQRAIDLWEAKLNRYGTTRLAAARRQRQRALSVQLIARTAPYLGNAGVNELLRIAHKSKSRVEQNQLLDLIQTIRSRSFAVAAGQTHRSSSGSTSRCAEESKPANSIPRKFREMPVDDFLRITSEWEQTDDRRCQLLEKEFNDGGCTAAENAEFDELQRLYDLRRSYCRWLRTGDANHPLIDVAVLRRLQEEDAGKVPVA